MTSWKKTKSQGEGLTVNPSKTFTSMWCCNTRKGTFRECICIIKRNPPSTKLLYQSISSEAREDLTIWKQFLEQLPPPKSFRMLSSDTTDICIYTDASQTVGFGATCQQDWFFGHLPSLERKDVNIVVLELYPILATLHVWKVTVEEKNITIYSDKCSYEVICQKKGYASITKIHNSILLEPQCGNKSLSHWKSSYCRPRLAI